MNTRVRRGRFWAYIIQCADSTYYAGSTNNLENRLRLHNAGKGAKYVRGRGPVAVVYQQAYRSNNRALQAERALKKLTRRQKEALVMLRTISSTARLASRSRCGRGASRVCPGERGDSVGEPAGRV